MAITQQRLLAIVQAAEHYAKCNQHLANAIVSAEKALARSDIAPDEVLPILIMAISDSRPLAQHAATIASEKKGLELNWKRNDYMRKRQERLRREGGSTPRPTRDLSAPAKPESELTEEELMARLMQPPDPNDPAFREYKRTIAPDFQGTMKEMRELEREERIAKAFNGKPPPGAIRAKEPAPAATLSGVMPDNDVPAATGEDVEI